MPYFIKITPPQLGRGNNSPYSYGERVLVDSRVTPDINRKLALVNTHLG